MEPVHGEYEPAKGYQEIHPGFFHVTFPYSLKAPHGKALDIV